MVRTALPQSACTPTHLEKPLPAPRLEHPTCTAPPPARPSVGCTLPQLWDALGDAAAEAGVRLEAQAVRTALWRLLVAEPGIRATEHRWGMVLGGALRSQVG